MIIMIIIIFNPVCDIKVLADRIKTNISYVTNTQSVNRCVNTISATPLDNNSDTTPHVHSETPTHPQKTYA